MKEYNQEIFNLQVGTQTSDMTITIVDPDLEARARAVAAADSVIYRYFNIEDGGQAVLAFCRDETYTYYAFSFCAPQDMFVKKIGRYNALTRLLILARWENVPAFSGTIEEIFNTYNEAALAAVNHTRLFSDGLPRWAREKKFSIRGKLKAK